MRGARISATGIGILCLAWLGAGPTARAEVDCGLTTTGLVPLTDLAGTYRGVPGGLYPNGATVRPPEHEAAGIDLAMNQVRPLDAQGEFGSHLPGRSSKSSDRPARVTMSKTSSKPSGPP